MGSEHVRRRKKAVPSKSPREAVSARTSLTPPTTRDRDAAPLTLSGSSRVQMSAGARADAFRSIDDSASPSVMIHRSPSGTSDEAEESEGLRHSQHLIDVSSTESEDESEWDDESDRDDTGASYEFWEGDPDRGSEGATIDYLANLVWESKENLVSNKEGDCIRMAGGVGRLLGSVGRPQGKSMEFQDVGAVMVAYESRSKFGNHTCRIIRLGGVWYAVDTTFGQFDTSWPVLVLPIDDWFAKLEECLGGFVNVITEIKYDGGCTDGDMKFLMSRIKGNEADSADDRSF